MKRIVIPTIFLVTHIVLKASLQVAPPFSHNAVLQQGKPIPIWGMADAGETVTVEFGVHKTKALANASGEWKTELEALNATTKPRPLKIRTRTENLVCENVVVGEVWLASGQSNMQWNLEKCSKSLSEVRTAMNNPRALEIRYLRIDAPAEKTPIKDFNPKKYTWKVDSPKTRPSQSAVAFFFAKRLHGELGVPIGIIDTSWGGKPIEGFIPRSEFQSNEILRPILELSDTDRIEELKKIEGGVFIRNEAGHPGRIFNGRIAPLIPYSVQGAIWYQGESNAGIDEDPRGYRHKMEALTKGWRKAFDNLQMPIYFVQLPPFRSELIAWARLREEQRLSLDLNNVGMAVTIDLRSSNIHPPNKIDVAERLARWPLAKVYKTSKGIPSGPIFESATFEGNEVRVEFSYVGKGLMIGRKEGLNTPLETPDAELEHFELRGNDNLWHPAKAIIKGSSVVVISDSVKKPNAVRYACQGAPSNANLYNRSGLPASPFSSDLESVPWINLKPK